MNGGWNYVKILLEKQKNHQNSRTGSMNLETVITGLVQESTRIKMYQSLKLFQLEQIDTKNPPYLISLASWMNCTPRRFEYQNLDLFMKTWNKYVICGLYPMKQIDVSIVNQITVIKMLSWLTLIINRLLLLLLLLYRNVHLIVYGKVYWIVHLIIHQVFI